MSESIQEERVWYYAPRIGLGTIRGTHMWINTLENKAMLAAGMAACVVVMARRANGRFPGWVPALALVGAVVAVAIGTWNVTTWGFHGQMHWAFSEATLRPGMASGAPEDPVFAGRALMYPWTAHWVYGHVARALGVTPMVVMAGTDVLWLAVMVLATGCAAGAMVREGDVRERRGAGMVAGFLAWTGVLVTDDAFIAQMGRLHGAIRPCMRMVPADKFFNPNNNPIGLALSALAVLCLVKLVTGTGRMWRWASVLAAAAFACGVLYPISYVGMVAIVVGGAMGVVVVRRRVWDARMVMGGVAVAVGGAGALPWMLAFDSGRQELGRIAATGSGEIAGKLAVIGAVAGLAIVLAVVAWRAQKETAGEEDRVRLSRGMLLGGVIGLAAAYIGLAIPLACEYKFLAQTSALMACVLGPWVAGLARGKKWWLAVLVLTLLGMGAADRELIRFYLDRTVPIEVRDGRAHAVDRDVDEMLTYLRERTPRNAVILAEEPLVMTVGGRAMYLLPSSLGVKAWDGWSMGRWKVSMAVIGHPTEMVKGRESVQNQLLGAKSAETVRGASGALRREFPGRAVYAVVGGDATSGALEESGAWTLREVFATRRVLELK